MSEWLALLEPLAALAVACVLGGVLGFERQAKGRSAGLRTHMLVALGATLFLLVGRTQSTGAPLNIGHVIQGVATGIGFIGAGTILKLTGKLEVQGLTTASSVWLAAGVGMAVGLGEYVLAVAATLLGFLILDVLRRVEKSTPALREKEAPPDDGEGAD
jgi:putative Mg2+ transporter-C (MgtC) family protein